MHDRIRHLLLGWWAGFVCDHPIWVLAAAMALAGASIWVTIDRLKFQPDRNDLISPKLEWNKRYIDYTHKFSGGERIVVIVETPEKPDGLKRARQFVDRLADLLNADPAHIEHAWSGFDASPILLRIAPMERFKKELDQMAEAGPFLKSKTPGELLSTMATLLAKDNGDGKSRTVEEGVEQIAQLHRVVAGIDAVLAGQPPEKVFTLTGLMGDSASTHEYLATPDGKLLIIDIDARKDMANVDPYGPAVTAVRQSLAKVQAEFPDIHAGLTGVPVLEADETAISTKDAERAAIYSAVLIAILLIVAYHGWQLPLLAIGALMMGVCWSFGFLTLAIGHIQVLSVVFTPILFGLGIDYGIHLMTRFEMIRHDFADDREGFRAAMMDTMQTVGPGMFTGAVTTALAFGTTVLTEFKGMAEMGLIAGVGTVLCLVAMWSVLPALMRLLRPRLRHVTRAEDRVIDLHTTRYLRPFVRHPVVTIAITAVILAASIVGMIGVRFDNNLMNMMPTDLEPLKWQRVITQHSDETWSAAVIVPSLEKAKEMTRRLQQLPSVASVGGVGRLFPPDESSKLRQMQKVRVQFEEAFKAPETPAEPESAASLQQRFFTLNLALNFAMQRKDVQDTPPVRDALGAIGGTIKRAIATLSSAEFKDAAPKRLAALQNGFLALRQTVINHLQTALSPRPLELGDLPEYLRRDAVSVTQPTEYQLQAFPRDDVWDPAKLEVFAAELRTIDPLVTGSPLQIHESGLLMERSYQLAGLMAISVVLLLVLLDMWSIIDTLLCMLPVTLGFITTFGVMYLAGYSINPANLMVLPLLFGIGVAQGVNIVHRYRQHPFERPLGLSQGTGKAIPLTSLTTIFAFAAMLPAEHRGIRSLGFVLSVGITLTLLACMTVMPASLELRNRIAAWRRLQRWRSKTARA